MRVLASTVVTRQPLRSLLDFHSASPKYHHRRVRVSYGFKQCHARRGAAAGLTMESPHDEKMEKRNTAMDHPRMECDMFIYDLQCAQAPCDDCAGMVTYE